MSLKLLLNILLSLFEIYYRSKSGLLFKLCCSILALRPMTWFVCKLFIIRLQIMMIMNDAVSSCIPSVEGYDETCCNQNLRGSFFVEQNPFMSFTDNCETNSGFFKWLVKWTFISCELVFSLKLLTPYWLFLFCLYFSFVSKSCGCLFRKENVSRCSVHCITCRTVASHCTTICCGPTGGQTIFPTQLFLEIALKQCLMGILAVALYCRSLYCTHEMSWQLSC